MAGVGIVARHDGLGDVLPRPSVNRSLHRVRRNAVLNRELVGCDTAGSIPLPRFLHQHSVQLSAVVRVSERVRFRATPLADHVGHVPQVVGQEHMRWADARPSVAVVADELSFDEDSTVCDLPRNTVSVEIPTIPPRSLNPSVALRLLAAGPNPTWTEFGTVKRDRAFLVNPLPEPLGNVSILMTHRGLTSVVPRRRLVAQRGGFTLLAKCSHFITLGGAVWRA
jgi:hypothetical protein